MYLLDIGSKINLFWCLYALLSLEELIHKVITISIYWILLVHFLFLRCDLPVAIDIIE